ncbi:E3 ubiquitin- ligase ORTHRUS 1 [Lecanosticta acicola]|uniref:E3 ubiquitin- ligase ORTHRUS 1 n=1 Tax=Lecanosticta acicola TaxID=111012 RepID=A0AAI8Z5U0_9PEZI|nr:E3 ubiquitin- ligase ORTHRUS 1 [Lecanosticta acicola]
MGSKFPTDLEGRVSFLTQERVQVVQMLAVKSSKAKGVPDPSEEPIKSLVARLDALLAWLDTDAEMTHTLIERSKIDEGLKLIFSGPNSVHFAPEHMKKAKKLHDKWEASNQGGTARTQPPVGSPRCNGGHSSQSGPENGKTRKRDESDREPEESRLARKPRVNETPDNIKRPPTNHSIWGVDGIMHGIALKRNGGKKSKVLNPDYMHEKRDAKVYGHNGLEVGRWFPLQLCALFHGAHGSSQAGIVGDPDQGAYSIVVAGQYDDLDTDNGDTLYYSGSGSHENTDPRRPAEATIGTRSLHASIERGNPVRVLRSHSGTSRWAPSRGLRYDGLYNVVGVRTPRNAKGGKYEQFRLERIEEGQIPLLDCRKRPDGKDLRDLDHIEWGYPNAR